MAGRPFKSYARINRIFPECIDKLEDESLSESEKQERATMIENCMKVCKLAKVLRGGDQHDGAMKT